MSPKAVRYVAHAIALLGDAAKNKPFWVLRTPEMTPQENCRLREEMKRFADRGPIVVVNEPLKIETPLDVMWEEMGDQDKADAREMLSCVTIDLSTKADPSIMAAAMGD